MSAVAELVETPTLEELGVSITNGHSEVLSNGENLIGFAIAVGEDLLAAEPMVHAGEWLAWLSANTPLTPPQARDYRRLARHRDVLASATGIRHGLRLISGVSDGRQRPGVAARAERDAEIHRLSREGKSRAEIAEIVGLTRITITEILDPVNRAKRKAATAERNRIRRAEQKALRQQEQQAALKKALVKEGQAFNEVWTMLLRMDDLLGQARGETEDREKREAIRQMHDLRDKMRDMAFQYLGIS